MITIERLEHHVLLVKAEADRLLLAARESYARLEQAEGSPQEPAVLYTTSVETGEIGRQFVRAQAALVARADDRFGAAQKVLGYCDEADERHSVKVAV